MSSFAFLAQATSQPWHSFGRPTTWQDVATIISGIAAVIGGIATVAAVIVAVCAIRQTQRQIRANEAAGNQQRKDIVDQQKQIERQLGLQSEQAITGPFFEMLAILQTVVQSTEVYHGFPNSVRMEGWNAFLVLYQQFGADSYRIALPNGNDPERRRLEISGKYREFHRNNQNTLSHYFRFLYNIVKYVNDSTLNEQKKADLIRLLRSNLSQHELLLLYYNGLTNELGFPNFFKLIRKYNLLDNLDKKELKVETDRDLYDRLPIPA